MEMLLSAGYDWRLTRRRHPRRRAPAAMMRRPKPSRASLTDGAPVKASGALGVTTGAGAAGRVTAAASTLVMVVLT